ncbi:MAG TPA: hypothetical protein PLP21_15800 [Pyrinomonadaceae bacterium]|nr:hypothetical protein [Pyrinomonadaceae bacterium]
MIIVMKLPGEEFVNDGIVDLCAGRETIPALLVAIGAPRLRQLGIDLPKPTFESPEHRLYLKLAAENPDSAHSRYNALIARLVSYEDAYKCAV